METQNSYKRTVAGSVGAGMGAIFNGSGRTYYILEHKTSSKYHSAGESQKIIIDQIEIGRDASTRLRSVVMPLVRFVTTNRSTPSAASTLPSSATATTGSWSICLSRIRHW